MLDGRGVGTVVVQQAVRGRAPNETDRRENRLISRTRARVEHAFAVMSGQAGRIFQRSVGLARNRAVIQLLNLCYNLQRYETILRLRLPPMTHA
jgi:IS5 family transposase